MKLLLCGTKQLMYVFPKKHQQPAPLNVFLTGVHIQYFDQVKYLGCIFKCITEGWHCEWHTKQVKPLCCATNLLLRSEIPSGMCAKLRSVGASNNRDHPTRSLYYCLFTPHTYIFVLRAHPVHGESYNQRNTTGEVATIPRGWAPYV